MCVNRTGSECVFTLDHQTINMEESGLLITNCSSRKKPLFVSSVIIEQPEDLESELIVQSKRSEAVFTQYIYQFPFIKPGLQSFITHDQVDESYF